MCSVISVIEGSELGYDDATMRPCERCGRSYREVFDTIIHIDYAETGRGKPGLFHLCVDCRKDLLQWIEEVPQKITT